MDKLTMYNTVRKMLLLLLRSSEFAADVTDFTWAKLLSDGSEVTDLMDEDATKLFNECLETLMQKMEKAIE